MKIILVAIPVILLSALAAGHALIRKREPRSSLWWVTICLFLPLVGPALYYFFGINRIHRKAVKLRSHQHLVGRTLPSGLSADLLTISSHMKGLSEALGRVLQKPLLIGNSIRPLLSCDEAYKEMTQTIESAQKSVALATYIFDDDLVGARFVQSLQRAHQRGVAVRVLLDAVGGRGSGIARKLKQLGIPVAIFLPTLSPFKTPYFNLRNHRKILIIDGRVGFTGGMNITQAVSRDIQFKVEGPLVSEIQDVFRTDWHFTTRELLDGPEWFPDIHFSGLALGRAIEDGPDSDHGKTRWAMICALAHARTSVHVMTPYLIPDSGLITALNTAALSGVKVEIILPSKTDTHFVRWAGQALLWRILERGCRVWLASPPFIHSKIMMVDGHWTLLGSSNWDTRSLRLNFELNVECYDDGLAGHLENYFESVKKHSREITLAEVDARPLSIKLRDGFARLFAPIL